MAAGVLCLSACGSKKEALNCDSDTAPRTATAYVDADDASITTLGDPERTVGGVVYNDAYTLRLQGIESIELTLPQGNKTSWDYDEFSDSIKAQGEMHTGSWLTLRIPPDGHGDQTAPLVMQYGCDQPVVIGNEPQ